MGRPVLFLFLSLSLLLRLLAQLVQPVRPVRQVRRCSYLCRRGPRRRLGRSAVEHGRLRRQGKSWWVLRLLARSSSRNRCSFKAAPVGRALPVRLRGSRKARAEHV